MGTFLFSVWLFFGLTVVVFILKLIAPKESYELRTSLIVAIAGFAVYAINFLMFIIDKEYLHALWPALGIAACATYIIAGGRSVAFKTQTAVFSRITGNPIAVLQSGSLKWVDPIFELTTVNPGVENVSANLKDLPIRIEKSAKLLTKNHVQAWIKDISFLLHLQGDVKELFNIEGGTEIVMERIEHFINEFFIGEISKYLPKDLEEDKHGIIERIAEELEEKINTFCRKMKYPFRVVNNSDSEQPDILIGDIELDPKYYESLAKTALAILDNEAKDKDAEALRKRVIDMGKSLLPSGTEAEQINAAQITLGLIQKNINETKLSLGTDMPGLIKEVIAILKGNK
jgi:hypothetical protein